MKIMLEDAFNANMLQRCTRFDKIDATVIILSFRTDGSGQTVQTQTRLLLEEQSDQALHCLLSHLHLFDETP